MEEARTIEAERERRERRRVAEATPDLVDDREADVSERIADLRSALDALEGQLEQSATRSP